MRPIPLELKPSAPYRVAAALQPLYSRSGEKEQFVSDSRSTPVGITPTSKGRLTRVEAGALSAYLLHFYLHVMSLMLMPISGIIYVPPNNCPCLQLPSQTTWLPTYCWFQRTALVYGCGFCIPSADTSKQIGLLT